MKILIYILMIVGLGLVVFNASKLDLENPFLGDSGVAAVGILAAACAVLLMIILQISMKIKRKKKQGNN